MVKIPVLAWALGSLVLMAEPVLAQDGFQRAQKAAEILGVGRDGACSSCHAMNSEQTLRRWSRSYARVQEKCLDNEALTAKDKLYCLADQTPDQELDLKPARLGFWSAALHLGPLGKLIQEALGEEAAVVLQTKLRQTTAMPLRSPTLLTADEFKVVQDWVDDGMPYLSELLSPYQGPTQCESMLAPRALDHLKAMKEWGWKKRNEERGMLMFACGADQQSCFRQQKNGQDIFPDVSLQPGAASWKADPATEMRVLTDLGQQTNYWIRSSADGRFIAYGGSPSGVVDLQSLLVTKGKLRNIPVDAYYDPAFFPDDSAFVFQGSGTAICSTSLLKNPMTTAIDFSEDACTAGDDVRIPLYQAVGASLDGADYLAATGDFHSDDGHGGEPYTLRNARSKLLLQPLEFDGTKWTRREAQSFDTPWEKDWGLSASNQLLLSRLEVRVDSQIKHIGYQLYQLNKDTTSSIAPVYSKELVGRLCFDGLKVGFSFDDRFVASYGYIKADQYALLGYASADDPEFQSRLNAGTANVFLFDLWTQKLHVVTHMGPGQFALFPHFRSDGWLYFMVYDQETGTRRLMTANNARLLQEKNPLP
ncbi:MAG TPA: hypothetical protein VE954_30050 [Oligoflexus sp.]|uniref:hypothetical protein n=1 Tax=Oligoflexus sp. TaxID=1971216 RepID=UPI002D469E58|nr:hypothetical protein [Oligoflexus sp.]HYX37367.1 hypothetical protein [Oligoflexus sp.]